MSYIRKQLEILLHLNFLFKFMAPERISKNNYGGGEEGNNRGIEVERKIARILSEQEIISRVILFDKGSPEDQNMIDIVVMLNPDMNFSVNGVNVQVKASSRGSQHFKEGLRRRLKYVEQNDEVPVDDQTYLLENRLILIVGDTKRSRSGHTSWIVSDDEIIDDFTSQLSAIDEYWRSK
jgi:hypothetical protein